MLRLIALCGITVTLLAVGCSRSGSVLDLEVSTGEGESSAVSDGDASGTEATDITSGVSTSAAEGEADGGDESTFVEGEDLDLSCGLPCDIFAEGDCPEGMKCTAVACEEGSVAWNYNVCRDIQGDAEVGDECLVTDLNPASGNDTCVDGAICMGVDFDTGLGSCMRFCDGSYDAPICPDDAFCQIFSGGALVLCLPTCNPLAQDCEQGQLCVPSPSGGWYECVPDASGDAAPYGTPCNYPNSCSAGLLCIDTLAVAEPSCADAPGCCSPYCSLAAGTPCPGQEQLCLPVFDPQPPGYEDVGVCAIP